MHSLIFNLSTLETMELCMHDASDIQAKLLFISLNGGIKKIIRSKMKLIITLSHNNEQSDNEKHVVTLVNTLQQYTAKYSLVICDAEEFSHKCITAIKKIISGSIKRIASKYIIQNAEDLHATKAICLCSLHYNFDGNNCNSLYDYVTAHNRFNH